MQLLERFSNSGFHAPNMAILKIGLYLGNYAHRAKVTSILLLPLRVESNPSLRRLSIGRLSAVSTADRRPVDKRRSEKLICVSIFIGNHAPGTMHACDGPDINIVSFSIVVFKIIVSRDIAILFHYFPFFALHYVKHRVSECYQSLTVHQHQKGIPCQNR